MTLAYADNRLQLFDQSDFGAKKGWYLAYENAGAEPLSASGLRLILAAGNGKEWRFIETRKNLSRLGEYAISVEIGGGRARLRVDGGETVEAAADLVPVPGPLVVGRIPDWANARADYWLVQRVYDARQGAKRAQGLMLDAQYRFIERPLERRFDLGEATEVSATTTVQVLDTTHYSLAEGIIDAYGQLKGAENPRPVRSDADLRATVADEARRTKSWTRDPALDPYGGLKTAAWHEKPTGFYRVVKRTGRWTMVSPEGNPLFYTGLCTAPAPRWDMTPVTGRESIFAALPPRGDLWTRGPWGDDADYFTPIGWSLKRKHGEDYEAKARASVKTRLGQWGFSGMGKWAEPIAGVPRIVDLSADWPKLSRHLDPFNPKARDVARASLGRQLAGIKGDPWVVGTSIGNEYDEIVTRDEIAAIQAGKDSPAKTALARLEPEAARKRYARAYYDFLYRTVRSIDKDHLYFGFWISVGWWQDESDWDLAAPSCDVIGYDRYSDAYAGMEERQKRTDKPTLLGEFSHPAWYGGTRGYGRYSVFTETDADSGRKYAQTVAAAAKDPYCVGALWFQYRDEPITGRGPGKGMQAAQGEHYAFGFVDVNDRPKWDLVTRARAANRRAGREKLNEKG